jgi:hypothetical protein
MYFDYTLVAITMNRGEYAVHGSLSDAWLDLKKLPSAQHVDVSSDNIYRDLVAPLAIWQAKHCLPDRVEMSDRISAWLNSLPESVCFILMHSSEFETFGGD